MTNDTLNPQQKSAVEQINGPIMIIAGPGSGKTRVITERIAHLINSGIDPQNILALTFTNKAAKEMVERINNITNHKNTSSIWMGTFHSVFAKILRKEARLINYSPNFTIYDNDDSMKLIRRIIKDLNLDKDTYNAKYIFSRISFMKNSLVDFEKYKKNYELIEEDKKIRRPLFAEIYTKYCNLCYQANCFDFDDLLLKTYELFKNNPDILNQYQHTFQYILIDEYQDTNKAQDTIIKQIGQILQNVCVVGDDSQSIYSFRGANINNMLNFKSFYKNVLEFKLEQNYRSTQNIVNAANSLIANNKRKIDKKIFSKNEDGEKIQLFTYRNGREEGEEIASIIDNLITTQSIASHHAVLYRTNSQSKVIEDALRKRGINYKIFGGLSFYQRKEIKDVLAYLKLIINQSDNESLIRVINYPTRGIGNTTIDKIRHQAEIENKSIWSIINSNELQNMPVSSNGKNNIVSFVNVLNNLISKQNDNIFKIIEELIQTTGIIRRLEDDPTAENISRIENISELVNTMKIFSMKNKNNKLTNFINEISLDESKEAMKDKSYVSLMTIHQSKGLEFPYIYIVGLENGLFPSQQSIQQKTLLEEERRLLYVAITRGIKKVTLSNALNRFRFGKIHDCEKSDFIDEINPLFIKNNNHRKFKYTQKIHKPPTINAKKLIKIKESNYSNEYREDIKIGQKINHNIFGEGEIKNIDLSGGNQKINVIFDDYGEKLLLTKFAKFKIIP